LVSLTRPGKRRPVTTDPRALGSVLIPNPRLRILNRDRNETGCYRVVPELPVSVVPPTSSDTVGNCATMPVTGHDGRYAGGQALYLNRSNTAGGGVVAKLSFCIVPPAFRGA